MQTHPIVRFVIADQPGALHANHNQRAAHHTRLAYLHHGLRTARTNPAWSRTKKMMCYPIPTTARCHHRLHMSCRTAPTVEVQWKPEERETLRRRPHAWTCTAPAQESRVQLLSPWTPRTAGHRKHMHTHIDCAVTGTKILADS